MNETPPESIVDAAVRTASGGPCAKSKRGVVIFAKSKVGTPIVFGNAFNSQPWPFECDGSDECKANCGRLCIHAEQRAIHQLLGEDLLARRTKVELELLHVKAVDGKLVPSRRPSCDECSKQIVEVGIRVVWLFVEPGIWLSYDSSQFHQQTLRNNGLHVSFGPKCPKCRVLLPSNNGVVGECPNPKCVPLDDGCDGTCKALNPHFCGVAAHMRKPTP